MDNSIGPSQGLLTRLMNQPMQQAQTPRPGIDRPLRPGEIPPPNRPNIPNNPTYNEPPPPQPGLAGVARQRQAELAAMRNPQQMESLHPSNYQPSGDIGGVSPSPEVLALLMKIMSNSTGMRGR